MSAFSEHDNNFILPTVVESFAGNINWGPPSLLIFLTKLLLLHQVYEPM
jgi:hypothetical protein